MCLPRIEEIYFAAVFDTTGKSRAVSRNPPESTLYKETPEMDFQRAHGDGLFMGSSQSLGQKNNSEP